MTLDCQQFGEELNDTVDIIDAIVKEVYTERNIP